MGILLKNEIIKRINHSDPNKKIVITPILDREQVSSSSVDIRLGNEFIVIRKTTLPSLNLQNREQIKRQLSKYQHCLKIEYGDKLALHPNQLVLGATLEYIKLPDDVSAYIIGKSSWGRLGLIIATATHISPGYKGSPTLEIVNIGEIPIEINPGIKIGQIVFHSGSGCGKYDGSYICPTGPEFSKVYEDPEIEMWGNQHNFSV